MCSFICLKNAFCPEYELCPFIRSAISPVAISSLDSQIGTVVTVILYPENAFDDLQAAVEMGRNFVWPSSLGQERQCLPVDSGCMWAFG